MVEQVDEVGRRVVVDRLPPGHFSLLDRLPPLRPAVRRALLEPLQGDFLVSLDCGRSGVSWHRDFHDLNQTGLQQSADAERIHIARKGALLIHDLRLEDSGTYR